MTSLLRLENERLKQQLSTLKQSRERAKQTVAEYIYNNNIEKEDLANKIKFLKGQIAQLIQEIKEYQRPSDNHVLATSNPYVDSNIEFDEHGEIKAGSLEKLVESLYRDFGVNTTKTATDYANIFLLTYRSFITAQEVLDYLIKGYQEVVQDPNSRDSMACRLRIGNFLRKWITENYHDFEEDTALQDRYSYFINEVMKLHDQKLGQSIAKIFQDRQKGLTKRLSVVAVFNEDPPQPIVPKGTPTSIVDISPTEVARQMTLMDYLYCKAIEPKECLGMAWTKDSKDEKSPNLLKSIRRFNFVSRWIAYLIVNENNIKKRVRIMTHILDILKSLRELNNFNGVFQLVAGLGNASVHRMTKTFAQLRPDKRKILEDLRVLTKPEKSWANYRKELHQVNPPCVPFLGFFPIFFHFLFARGLSN